MHSDAAIGLKEKNNYLIKLKIILYYRRETSKQVRQ
jgi:hypothetical protein